MATDLIKLLANIALILIVFSACTSNSDNNENTQQEMLNSETALIQTYTHWDDLVYYINKELANDYSAKEVDTLMIIPMNSCASCVSYSINALCSNTFNGALIIGGKLKHHPEYKDHLRELHEKRFFYHDSTYLMNSYNLGIGGPVILFKQKEQVEYIHLTYGNWPDVIPLLGWKEPSDKASTEEL